MALTVRPRRALDAPALVAALESVHLSDAYPVHRHHVTATWLYDGIDVAWVAEQDDRIVGHVALAHEPTGWHLTRFFVEAAGRGSGAGSALIGRAESWADAAGHDLLLDVVEHNHDARRMYEARGWTFAGTTEATWISDEGPWPQAFMFRRTARPT